MKRTDVQVVEKKTPYKGFFQLDVYTLRHKLFSGGWSNKVVRENFERRHMSSVLLFDPNRDELVFIRQFRIGAFAALQSRWFSDDTSPWVYEIPAGLIEEGEAPEDVAQREAQEESGCIITDLIPIAHYLASPSGSSESVFLFCGCVDAEGAGGIYGNKNEDEDIKVDVISVSDALDALNKGLFNNAMTLIAMQWLSLHHETVRTRWRT